MENEKRLFDAIPLIKNGWHLVKTGKSNKFLAQMSLADVPTVDAVEVVHGHWKEYSHSALVRWKDGEPIWADRSVFRCSRCDFGTIARHNYCPRCGAKMDGGNEDG